jgi:serine/threonine-protein kinase RIO1
MNVNTTDICEEDPLPAATTRNMSSDVPCQQVDEEPPPAETTRPARTVTQWASGSPQRSQIHSMRSIMRDEEEREAKRLSEKEEARMRDAQEEELVMLALERSKSDVWEPDSEEDELVRQALERSMTDLHASMSSGCALDFALKVQAESETTERFIESPHKKSNFSRRIFIKPPNSSQRSLFSNASQRSLLSRNASQRSLLSSSWGSVSSDVASIRHKPSIARGSSVATLLRTNSERTNGEGSIQESLSSSASEHLTSEERDQISKALRESDEAENHTSHGTPQSSSKPSALEASSSNRSLGGYEQMFSQEQQLLRTQDVMLLASAVNGNTDIARSAQIDECQHLSSEDEIAIERALREADEEEERKSVRLVLQMLQEDATEKQPSTQHRGWQQGNVRTMTRAELQAERDANVGAFNSNSPPRLRHPLEEAEAENVSVGFRMNASNRQQWARRDQHSIIGPNNEIRTKHDTSLQGHANAHRLGLDTEEDSEKIIVGNQAYNSFMKSVRRTKKGVAAHGTGRAGSDADSTKGGAMDPAVRIQISRAVNNGLIEKCNGVVKEGKEAIVYHADKGIESGGFDVAVKVFKRIQEFRTRGDYVDGDPRYSRASFRKASARGQLEMWTEKEYRNLVRANRAGVPVPTPLQTKENILYMRFLGTDGWPAPQLREINLRRGSARWITLYNQVIGAMMR